MKTLTRMLAPLLAACALAGPASASPVLSLQAHPSTVYPPGNVLVDIVISGLQSGGASTLLGAFDLTVTFDAAVLPLVIANSSLGSALGDAADPAQTLVGAIADTPGVFRFYEVSLLEASAATCLFCTGPFLEDLQGDSFTLASLAFYAPSQPDGVYSTTIGLLPGAAVFSDAYGNAITDVAVQDHVTVSIPEPGSLLLLATALLAATGAGRSHRRATGRRPAA